MPFSKKQSDIFFNDDTKEMFVCTVSAITANRCESEATVYGAVPIVYKIDKDTNYKQTVYPPNIDTFETDENSDLYKLTTPCAIQDLNFDSITKPLINFNKDTSRYSITFLGRFSSDVKGLVINNYIFEDVDNRFHLLNAKSLLPENSLSASNGRYTFDGGYINSNYYTGGNIIRNMYASWFDPASGGVVERSPDYQVAPTYVESTSALGFNLIQDFTDTEFDALTGDKNFPFMYNGGYINVNPKYMAFDPEHTIRVDFRARSFNVPSPTAYASSQTTGTSASRWIQQYNPTAGEGFCVYFYKQPEKDRYVVPNGVGSTLGYSPADFNPVEVAGSAHTTVGLFERKDWNPFGVRHPVYGSMGGSGDPAESFLGIGFDIAGNFAKTIDDKPGWFDGETKTVSPCSVAVRSNRFTNNQILTAVDLSAVPGSTAIPLHTSAADAVFVDYRVDLTNKGNRLTVSHKLTSSDTYNTILDLRLNKMAGPTAEAYYNPWSGIDISKNYPLLNVGMSFTTSTKASQFELQSFEVTGVKVFKPWEVKLKTEDTEDTERNNRIDYINKSSENLRKRLLNVESNENVNVEMVVPAKGSIAQNLYEDNNTAEITLCDSNNTPEIIEDDVEVKYTSILPETIDKVIQATEKGTLIPEIGGSPIPKTVQDITTTTYKEYEDKVVPVEPKSDVLPTLFTKACRTAGTPDINTPGKYKPPFLWLYESKPFIYNNNTHVLLIRGIKTTQTNTSTLYLYRKNKVKLEEDWLSRVQEQPKDNNNSPYKYWELHVTSRSLPGVDIAPDGWNSNSQLDYSTDISEWSFQPKINADGLAWSDEDYDNALIKDTRGNNFGILCALNHWDFDQEDEEEGTEEEGTEDEGTEDEGTGGGEDPKPTGKCEKIKITDIPVILRDNLPPVTLNYVQNIPVQSAFTIGGAAASDVLIELKLSNDQGCFYISVQENKDSNTLTNNSLEAALNNVKGKLRDLGNKGPLKGRITGL